MAPVTCGDTPLPLLLAVPSALRGGSATGVAPAAAVLAIPAGCAIGAGASKPPSVPPSP